MKKNNPNKIFESLNNCQSNEKSLLDKAREYAKFDQDFLAKECYEIFLNENPNHAKGWHSFGLFLNSRGNFKESAEALKKAVSFDGDNIFYRNALVGALKRAGDTSEAIKEGHLSLATKDKLAIEYFKKSNYSKIELNNVYRKFNFKKKKRNIIAFSLWGDNPAYVTGALINAQLIPFIYDGWTARFYCDESVPERALEALRKMQSEVILVTDDNEKKLQSLWRFFASDDTDIDYFLCRDADSRVNVKEAIAVQEWVNSDKRFHIMRDNIVHHELILAGMWGGVSGVLPNMKNILLKSEKYFNNKAKDQTFLREIVWPLIKDDSLVHDRFYSTLFPNGKAFSESFTLPDSRHIGGCVKNIPAWQQSIYDNLL